MNKATFLAKQKSHLKDEYMYFSDILEDEKEDARETGLAEGRKKQALEAARNLLRMNLGTHEQIAKAQGLAVEEVDRIAEELKAETVAVG